jgi:hypothetical protein
MIALAEQQLGPFHEEYWVLISSMAAAMVVLPRSAPINMRPENSW